ncbi:hypothetical protein XMIN_3365 [Xanthomonas citri pv. mangiferaeindicae LMG 941]|nr:hypothetical protein XAR_2310 [Xanthomonas citri pv. glycines str. 8ra]CCG38374.1 hypothetical protein XMIN_3365 [Xanthomonas citri pv. mangiferaeindicae LMG 941]
MARTKRRVGHRIPFQCKRTAEAVVPKPSQWRLAQCPGPPLLSIRSVNLSQRNRTGQYGVCIFRNQNLIT